MKNKLTTITCFHSTSERSTQVFFVREKTRMYSLDKLSWATRGRIRQFMCNHTPYTADIGKTYLTVIYMIK